MTGNSTTKDESRKFMTVFSTAAFLHDLGSDMIYPIWPMFVTSFAGASVEVLGLIDGLGDAVVNSSQAASGYISDRIRKRKVFVWLGYLFGGTSRIGYALSTAWQHLIPFRILDRSGKIRGAPRDAIIADISTDQNRGRNFGMLRAMDNLGAVFGIITCLILTSLFGLNILQPMFLIASVPSFIGAALIFVFIKDRKTNKLYKGLSFKDLTLNFRLFLFLSGLFAMGSFSYSFLLIYVGDLGVKLAILPLLEIQILAYLVFNVVASLTSLPFGWLADKLGRKPLLLLAFSLWGIVCFGFIYATSLLEIGFLFILYGLHKGAIEPVQKTLVSELAPIDFRASTIGAFQMVIGLIAFPASFFAGILWVNFGKLIPFYFSLILTIAAAVLLLFLKESKRSKNTKPAIYSN